MNPRTLAKFQVFEYVFESASSFLTRIKVFGHVVNLYFKKGLSIEDARAVDNTIFQVKQSDPACFGMPLTPVYRNSFDREEIVLHAGENPVPHHIHASTCRPPSASHFSSIIKRLQRLDAANNPPVRQHSFETGQGTIKMQIQMPRIIDEKDARQLCDAFAKFQQEHNQTINSQFENYRKEAGILTNSEMALDLFLTCLLSSGMAFGLAMFRNTMSEYRIPKEKINEAIDILLIILLYRFSDNKIPILATVMIRAVHKLLTLSSSEFDRPIIHSIRDLLSLGFFFTCSNTPASVYKGVKYLASIGSSFVTDYGYRKAMHYLFPPTHFAGLRPGFINDMQANNRPH